MSEYFRRWNIDQTLLLPPNARDFVPKSHVLRFISRDLSLSWRGRMLPK
jgi:hypothetical protein